MTVWTTESGRFLDDKIALCEGGTVARRRRRVDLVGET